jgi:hypothetical protein
VIELQPLGLIRVNSIVRQRSCASLARPIGPEHPMLNALGAR